jgi:hypothetical protein
MAAGSPPLPRYICWKHVLKMFKQYWRFNI